MKPRTDKDKLARAMREPDSWVVVMRYLDSSGSMTERCVSPIRFIGQHSMLALCLCREEPRRFELSKCGNVRLVSSDDVLMPVAIKQIG